MQRVTIKDVARELNIAVGTVSKALNGKAGVSEATRAAVQAKADEMGYNANPLARSLVLSPIRIGIVLPKIWQEFYGYLAKGIDLELASQLDRRVQGEYAYISDLNAIEEITGALRAFGEGNVDAVIVCPAFDMDYEGEIEHLRAAGIPVVILGNPMDSAAKLTAIYSDSYKAGALAADCARMILAPEGEAAVFIGKKDVWDHREKVRGFEENFSRPVGVYETYDRPEQAYELTCTLLEENSSLEVIYVATGNSVAVCRALQERQRDVRVIATDIFPQMRPFVQQGVIAGVVFQDLIWQGRRAVQVLCRYLTRGIIPEGEIRTFPRFVLKSNFDDYLSQLEQAEQSG